MSARTLLFGGACLWTSFILIGQAQEWSLGQHVFLPLHWKSNPFDDCFIQRIVDRDPGKSRQWKQLNDSQLGYLLNNQGNNGLSRMLLPHDSDNYETIFNDALDDQLTMQDDIDSEWINLVTSGPLVVTYITELMVLAGKRDFPLSRPVNFAFQYISNPNSFRATIGQVARLMFMSFSDAHGAMNTIQSNMEQIPNYVRTALQIVLAGSPTSLQTRLPQNLDRISSIANESATIAASVYNRFANLQNVISELIEANTYTHSSQSQIVERIQNEINESKRNQSEWMSTMNNLDDQHRLARQEVEKARRDYEAAYRATGSTRGFLKKAFRRIISSVVSVVTTSVKGFLCIFRFCRSDASRRAAEAAAAETARRNAIDRANQMLQLLNDAQQRETALAQQHAQQQQLLQDIMNKIASLDLSRMSEQEIVDILVESMVQLSKVKEHWSRLVRFFSIIAISSDSIQQIIITEFVKAIREANAADLLLQQSDREMFTEILSLTSQDIERQAHLLYIMSKTYYDISSEYIIGQMIEANSVMFLTTDTERTAALQSLISDATAISQKITQLAVQRQNEYKLRNYARRQEYERFIMTETFQELSLTIG